MRTALAIALIVGGITAQTASAQRVIGRVVELGTSTPVTAAFVTVLNEAGDRIAAFLTGPDGSFAFDLPAPGRVTLRAERIGHATADAGPVDVAATDTLDVQIETPTAAIPLNAIDVVRGGRCSVRPEAAAAAARIWEEIRKALEVARWSRDGADLRFRATSYTRRLDADGRVLHQRERPAPSAGHRSWFPVELPVLDSIGYIRSVGDSLTYFAPDAEVFLSDHFLDRHCIEAVAGDDDRIGLVGLRFRPAPGRTVPEIEGTLWLSGRTSELRFLEYAYVQAEQFLPIEQATARVDFNRTSTGIWYVDRWSIRMPDIVQRGRNYELRGWYEDGGIVLGVSGVNRSRSPRESRVETTPAAAFEATAPQIFP